MIILLPLRVVGPAGAPAAVEHRSTPITWWCVGVMVAVAMIDLLAGGRIAHGWPVMPAVVARWWCDVAVRLPLYQDPELFVPTQLWTAVVVQDAWFGRTGAWFFTTWQVVMSTMVVIIAGRALEHALGRLSFAAVLMLLAPLVGAVHLRIPGVLVLGTSVSFAVALAATAWGFLGTHRVQMTLAYWLVVVVGAVPFHVHLRWLALSLLLSEAGRLMLGHVHDAREQGVGLCTAVLLGFAIGICARWVLRMR